MHPKRTGEHAQPWTRLNGSNSRRMFMKRVVGGLAIGVPAYKVLAGTGVAQAATNPDACSGGCPPIVIGTYCAGAGGVLSPNVGCEGPDVAACMIEYNRGPAKKDGYCFEE
jgi:hypothetical protein